MNINTPLGRKIMLEWTLKLNPSKFNKLETLCCYCVICLSIYLSKNESEISSYIEDISEKGVIEKTLLTYKNKTYDINKIGLSNLEIIQNNEKG